MGSPGTLCHSVALHACELAGFRPAVRHHADDFNAVLALVAAGQGVALVPQLAIGQPPPESASYRSLSGDVPASRTGRARGGHPAVAACVTALRTATRDHLEEEPPARGGQGGPDQR